MVRVGQPKSVKLCKGSTPINYYIRTNFPKHEMRVPKQPQSADFSPVHRPWDVITAMFKKGHSIETRKPVFTPPVSTGNIKWKYLLVAIITGAGTIGVALSFWLTRSKPRKAPRRRSILVEPPSSTSVEDEEPRGTSPA